MAPFVKGGCHGGAVTEGSSQIRRKSDASSEQTALTPFPAPAYGRLRKLCIAPLLLLSKSDPLRWAPISFLRGIQSKLRLRRFRRRSLACVEKRAAALPLLPPAGCAFLSRDPLLSTRPKA